MDLDSDEEILYKAGPAPRRARNIFLSSFLKIGWDFQNFKFQSHELSHVNFEQFEF